jgi:hypothetical protein
MLEGRGRRTELMYLLVLVVGHLDIGQILPGTGSLVTFNTKAKFFLYFRDVLQVFATSIHLLKEHLHEILNLWFFIKSVSAILGLKFISLKSLILLPI